MLHEEDIAILRELRSDSRLTTREIAKRIKTSPATVHRRLNNLIKEGYISKFTIIPNWSMLGKKSVAYILISVDYAYLKKAKLKQREVALKLIEHPFVFDATTVTGTKDIVLKIRVADTQELDKFIDYLRTVDGVHQTETLVGLFDAPGQDNPFEKPFFE